jgi:hypothetical protein
LRTIDVDPLPVGIVDTATFGTFASGPYPLRLLDARNVASSGRVDLSAQPEHTSESTNTVSRIDASAPTLPGPGTLGLIGVGLLCIAVLVRRRRRP